MKTLVINSKLINKGRFRLDGGFYLNIHSFLSLYLEANEERCVKLEDIADVMNPPVFKRQFCSIKGNAVEYFQSSDVSLASNNSEVYIYRPQAEKIGAIVHEGDILVTGFGSIGNVRLVSKSQNNVCYANNVARIFPRGSVRSGFLYAFLMSKFGNAQLNKNASGSVVRYIEAPGIRKTLIPNLPETLQKKVDDLVQESTKLREDASDKLKDAQELILNELRINISKRNFGKVSISSIIQSHNSRFEANFHISEGADIERYLWSHYKCKPLGDLCTSISRPNIFKRYYVDHGITFLGGADIFLATPNSDKQLSKKKTENINDLLIEEGTILLPRSGTIGNVAWAHAGHAQKLASEHVIRLKPNDILRGGYLFAFLSTSIGRSLIQKHIFGSVIQHVEPPHLNLIPIPILDDRIIAHAHENVITYSKCMGEAIKKESQAIALVEQEIESWNKK